MKYKQTRTTEFCTCLENIFYGFYRDYRPYSYCRYLLLSSGYKVTPESVEDFGMFGLAVSEKLTNYYHPKWNENIIDISVKIIKCSVVFLETVIIEEERCFNSILRMIDALDEDDIEENPFVFFIHDLIEKHDLPVLVKKEISEDLESIKKSAFDVENYKKAIYFCFIDYLEEMGLSLYASKNFETYIKMTNRQLLSLAKEMYNDL